MKEAIKMLKQAVAQIANGCADDIPAEDVYFFQMETLRHVAEWLSKITSADMEDTYMNIIMCMANE